MNTQTMILPQKKILAISVNFYFLLICPILVLADFFAFKTKTYYYRVQNLGLDWPDPESTLPVNMDNLTGKRIFSQVYIIPIGLSYHVRLLHELVHLLLGQHGAQHIRYLNIKIRDESKISVRYAKMYPLQNKPISRVSDSDLKFLAFDVYLSSLIYIFHLII